jgi:ketosteroid isomerase-like protein
MYLIVAAALGIAVSSAVEGFSSGSPRAHTPSGQTMEDRQITALTAMMDAVNAGDAAAYARLYADDASITIFGTTVLQGRQAIEQYEVGLLREFPGARLGFYDVWQKGSVAVVHYAVTGSTARGQAMGHEGLLFYRFHPSGLIAEERRYLDSLTPMAQLGALGARRARSLPAMPARMNAHVATDSPDERENVARVKAALGALQTRDRATFLSNVAEGAVFTEMIEPDHRPDHANAKTWLESWTAAIPDATFDITNAVGVGDFVLVEMITRGTFKGPLGPLMSSDSNKAFEVHRASIVRLKNGSLISVTAFMNGKELAEAVGQWPLPPAR